MKIKPINQLKILTTIGSLTFRAQASKSGITKWIYVVENGKDVTRNIATLAGWKVNNAGAVQICGSYEYIIEALTNPHYTNTISGRQLRFNQ